VSAMVEQDWTKLGLDIGAALLAAGAVVGLTGNWATGVFVFTAVLNLELGSTIWDFLTQRKEREEPEAFLEEQNAKLDELLEERFRLQSQLAGQSPIPEVQFLSRVLRDADEETKRLIEQVTGARRADEMSVPSDTADLLARLVQAEAGID